VARSAPRIGGDRRSRARTKKRGAKREPEPDGTYRIDFEAFVREGVRLSADPRVDWKREGDARTEVHPTQGPVPDGRVVFDVHRHDE
jgi:hypothetical protein